MTVSANSYGTAAGVAALVPLRASGTGDSVNFTSSTRPTITQVEAQIDQISALVNAMLAEAGFSIPVSQASGVLLLTQFVQQEVAAIVEGINGSGRFGPTAKQVGGRGRFAVLVEDAHEFIEVHKVGLERLGATRSTSVSSGIAYRDTDEGGDDTFPIFQRDAFGNEFDDWGS